MSSVPKTNDSKSAASHRGATDSEPSRPETEQAKAAVLSGGRRSLVAARVAVAPSLGAVAPGPSPLAPETIGLGDEAPERARPGNRPGNRPFQEPSSAARPESEPNPLGAAEPTLAAPGREAAAPEARAALGVARWPANREAAERSLERRIRAHLTRAELSVILTDNRYTMISVRREGKDTKRFKARLHHMFADASPVITRALARYIVNNDRAASKILGEYIDANQHRVRSAAKSRSSQRLITKGRIHDLRDIFDDLNRRYFGDSIEARITWGQRARRPKRRNSIKMGSYSVEDRLIRIHRSLDRPFVPRFFVEWVVFHEMLHQVHDIKVVNGRRRFHSKEFLRDEATFEHYAEARAWERANLDALLTC